MGTSTETSSLSPLFILLFLTAQLFLFFCIHHHADPSYVAFLASLDTETVKLPSAEIQLEQREREKAALAAAGTPMDEFGQIEPSPLVKFMAEKRKVDRAKSLAEQRKARAGRLGGLLRRRETPFIGSPALRTSSSHDSCTLHFGTSSGTPRGRTNI